MTLHKVNYTTNNMTKTDTQNCVTVK